MVVAPMMRRRHDRPLDLDSASRGHDGSREQRRDVAGAGGEHADRGCSPARACGACCCGCTGAGCSASTSSAAETRTAAEAQQLGEDPERSKRRHERCDLAADSADLAPELATSTAVAHMAPGRGIRTDAAIVGQDQLLADLAARRLACFQRLREPDPGPYEQRFHRSNRDAEGLCQVGICHAPELAHQQCRALLIREPSDVGDEPPKRLALLGFDSGIMNRRANELHHLGSGS
jgi:hypothetical protein